jgi:small-conductance mechanosensitive channel
MSFENEIIRQLMFALVIVVSITVLVSIIRRVIRRYIDEPERLYRASKLVGRVGGLLAAVLVLGVFFNSTRDLLTVLTVVGAGLAIAMRETLLSFFGWIYIAFRAPYTTGDRIEINGVQGDVIDIRLLQTILMEIRGWVDADQSTGRIANVPNGAVFLGPVYNYTRGFHFIWNELPITITFRSDWEAAREIILSFAEESAAIVEQQAHSEIRKMSREFLVYYNILTPFVYVKIVENGVRLTLRYLCEVRKRRGTEHALTISILAAFREHGGIELAYPMIGVSTQDTSQFGPVPDTSGKSPRQRGGGRSS